MRKLALILLFILTYTNAHAEAKDLKFEKILSFIGQFEENLYSFYQKPLMDLTKEEEKSIANFLIERKINPKYIEEYENKLEQKYAPNEKVYPWLATHYNPEYFIEYLEKIPARTLAQKYQLLVLWQIYKPEKINSEEYRKIAEEAHTKTTEYLSDNHNWQASWRRDEYEETIQGDFQKCYADTNCLLKAIPYWMDLHIPMNVILPCDFAKAHNLVYYADGAAGGSGTQTIMISTCILEKKYELAPELETYIDNIISEEIPYSSGSITHVYYATAQAHYWDIKYQPNFNSDKAEDWREFPYTEWAVQSYYNFKKFNSVLNDGIDYKKAVEMLKEHYIKVFNVTSNQALNAALTILNPPSSKVSKRITPNNLNYLLLTGAPWEKIQKQLSADTNLAKLLELSIAHPQNLQQLIKLIDTKDIDEPNEFGKTPLQTAAQYGYLESVKLLLAAGANINHQTHPSNCWSEDELECIHNGQRTALMYALQEGNFKLAQYLLDQKADITLTDSLEYSALDYLTKTAPKFSTHELMSIYGGNASEKVTEDAEQIPQQQYTRLYAQLFFNQQPQIAHVLKGKWQANRWNTEENFFQKKLIFTKNTNPDMPLLTFTDDNGTLAECNPQEDSHNVFNCKIKTAENKEILFYLDFKIAHYGSNDQLEINGIEQQKFAECKKDNFCATKNLAKFQRETKNKNDE